MYAELADITAGFDPTLWDPSRHQPSTTTVEGWLADEAAVLDGQLAHIVATPVSAADSPTLHALCRRIVALRGRAAVYDFKLPPQPSEQVTTRLSQVWRSTAEDLVKGILAGGTADGVVLSAGASALGAPIGEFGTNGPFGERERQW